VTTAAAAAGVRNEREERREVKTPVRSLRVELLPAFADRRRTAGLQNHCPNSKTARSLRLAKALFSLFASSPDFERRTET
jgi:hypothetical protein